MQIDRRSLMMTGLAGASGLAYGTTAMAQTPAPTGGPNIAGWPAPTETIDLWPKGAPGSLNKKRKEVVDERSTDPLVHSRAVEGVSVPRLCVFPAANPNGGAMIITPGGGYARIVLDHEGYQLAAYLNSVGITAFVLFYRLPAEGWEKAADVPLMDAQRAMRLVRANASRYKIDPARVGFMGFSAGGHVCASVMTRYDASVYAPVDAADSLSARPALCAPIYPVQSMDKSIAHMGSRDNLLGKSPTLEQVKLYSPDQNVTPQTPPAFLAHAEDDGAVSVANSLNLRAALKAQGVLVETHLFPEGGHGFGMRTTDKTWGLWPQLFVGFARARGLMG
jgi:acetyl esterase/lipase